MLLVTWYESNTWLQFTRELTKVYNLPDSSVCIHFPLRDTQLSLAPVYCNESVGFLGNWTQSLCEYLHGKQHNRPDSHKSKIPHHTVPTIGMEFCIFAETIIGVLSYELAFVVNCLQKKNFKEL